jgi:hypothetical protein
MRSLIDRMLGSDYLHTACIEAAVLSAKLRGDDANALVRPRKHLAGRVRARAATSAGALPRPLRQRGVLSRLLGRTARRLLRKAWYLRVDRALRRLRRRRGVAKHGARVERRERAVLARGGGPVAWAGGEACRL